MTVSVSPDVTNIHKVGVVTNSYGSATNSPFVLPPSGLAAHYDASNSSSITLDVGVSNWADLSGNGRDLIQATGADQPAYSGNSITFDGVSDFLKAAAFTLNQPETVYIVMNQASWTINEYMVDGNAALSMAVASVVSTPTIAMYAGSVVANNSNLAVGADGVVCAVFNGASSSIKVNDTTTTTGNAGAANAGGLTIGAQGGSISFSNIIVYEVAVYSVAHDAATQASIIQSLMNKWEI